MTWMLEEELVSQSAKVGMKGRLGCRLWGREETTCQSHLAPRVRTILLHREDLTTFYVVDLVKQLTLLSFESVSGRIFGYRLENGHWVGECSCVNVMKEGTPKGPKWLYYALYTSIILTRSDSHSLQSSSFFSTSFILGGIFQHFPFNRNLYSICWLFPSPPRHFIDITL